jgi:hypothetical protein
VEGRARGRSVGVRAYLPCAKRPLIEFEHRQEFVLLCTLDPGLEMANVPWQLSALALRRHALKHHDSLKSLLEGREYHIKWKDELLDKPFFVASGARGMSVNPAKPMTDDYCRRYLRRTAEACGLGGACDLGTAEPKMAEHP